MPYPGLRSGTSARAAAHSGRVLGGTPGVAQLPCVLRLVPRAQVHQRVPDVHQHDELARAEGVRDAEPVRLPPHSLSARAGGLSRRRAVRGLRVARDVAKRVFEKIVRELVR